MRQIEIVDLHQAEYSAVYQMQLELVEKRKASQEEKDTLLLVEHPAVYTFGRKTKTPIPPLVKDIAFEIERGGEGTYHNPGQLVAYPIVKLKPGEQDLHLHLRRLEQTVINLLLDYSLHGERRPGATGVWIRGKQKKIASVGVAVKSWVTYHGVALNVCNDLSGFSKINPCGFEAGVMTSLEKELEESQCPAMTAVKRSFARHFEKCFTLNSF